MPLTLVYAGTPEFAVPALEAIAASPHKVRAVLTQPDRPAGRGRVVQMSPVKRHAFELGLPVLQPATLNDPTTVTALAACAADLLVVVAYGLLLPPAVLALPRLGGVNIHASLLPRWRGAAPIQRALLAGDRETGVAIMRMETGLDTGAVYATERVPIGSRDTALSLATVLAERGAALLLTTLAALEAGTAVAVPQASAGVTYARKLEKGAALIDWSRSAAELDRQVRALLPWPVAETRFRGAQLKLHEAVCTEGAAAPPGTIMAAGRSGIDVATGAGQLRLQRVQLPGRTVIGAAEFARAAIRGGPLVGARFDGAP
ncbi:MAG TPA: methionyl-tRNA formyltransferase [Steroidobacteraceae bacterium]|nr:methionyl-tRNA formyltransferase [Steroidobacteraceae bacterium]